MTKDKIFKTAYKQKEQGQNFRSHEEYKLFEKTLHHQVSGRYLGDMVFGANDGIVTTFAVVAGAFGGDLSLVVIIILGFANLLGDGFSMGLGNYLGIKSSLNYKQLQRTKEEWEVEHFPQAEKDEVQRIFLKKGFSETKAQTLTDLYASNKEAWVDFMMNEEHGISSEENNSPARHGLATFMAFFFAGLLPLLPFIVPIFNNPFIASAVVTLLVLFSVGAFRSKITTVSWWQGGLEMLLIGSVSSGAAYFIGWWLERLLA